MRSKKYGGIVAVVILAAVLMFGARPQWRLVEPAIAQVPNLRFCDEAALRSCLASCIRADPEFDVEGCTRNCLAACIQVDLPDLVPLDDQGRPPMGQNPVRFCNLDGQGRLIVTVRNQGGAFASAFITTVTFFDGGVRDLPSPGLSPGETRNLTPIPIPAECFNPDCEFSIDVDSGDSVEEGIDGEENNFAFGRCIG
jgi:CARDB